MYTVPPIVTSILDSTIQAPFEQPFGTFRYLVIPAAEFIAKKVQALWEFALPYIASAAKFLLSEGGAFVELLCLSTISGVLSQTVKSRSLSIALIAISVLCTIASSLLYAHLIDPSIF